MSREQDDAVLVVVVALVDEDRLDGDAVHAT
jgi:hypothetical protein